MTGSQHGCISPVTRLRSLDTPALRSSLVEQDPERSWELALGIWVSGEEREMRGGLKALASGDWGWEVHCASGRASGSGLSKVAACWIAESPKSEVDAISNCGEAVTR